MILQVLPLRGRLALLLDCRRDGLYGRRTVKVIQLLSHLAPYPFSAGGHREIGLEELAESRGKVKCVLHHFYCDL